MNIRISHNYSTQALEALAHGLIDGGCNYVTNFPGFYSQALFNLLNGKHISLNEKIAYEMAFGASLGGVRSVATFKSFGLNVAADPFLNSIISGVNAGLVLVLTEDVEVEGSQCRQDSRHYRDFYGGLWFEPSSLEEAYSIGYHSFLFSESLDLPIVIRLTNQFFKLQGTYTRKPPLPKPVTQNVFPEKYLLHPFYSQSQRQNLKKKRQKTQEFVEEFYHSSPAEFPRTKEGYIVLGNCEKETQNYDKNALLPLTTYPLPIELIKRFIASKEKITIFEQGNHYGFYLIKALTSSNKIPLIESSSGSIPDHSARYINWTHLEKLFKALKSVDPSIVIGDLGQYTKESTNTIQACLCLGACIPIGIGLCEAGIPYPFCISGDMALIHAGIGILNELRSRGNQMGVLILDNRGSQSTGGQVTSTHLTMLENFEIETISINYNESSEEDLRNLFRIMKVKGETKIVVIKC